MRKYLIAGAIILTLGLISTIIIQQRLILKHKNDIARLSENYKELTKKEGNTTILLLKQKEVTGQIKRERDSLAKLINIRPRNVTKIVRIDLDYHAAERAEIPLIKTVNGNFKVIDSTACYTWKGELIQVNDSLKLIRTNFDFHSETTETYFKYRPKKFLFIQYGRWIYTAKVSSNCGTTTTKIIEFTK